MAGSYLPESITRDELDATPGVRVIQFGTNWCGYCQAAEKVIEPVFARQPGLRRILVEDGKGRPLGRSFRVKLWPTLIVVCDGVEVARVVRPWSEDDVEAGLRSLIAGRPESVGPDVEA